MKKADADHVIKTDETRRTCTPARLRGWRDGVAAYAACGCIGCQIIYATVRDVADSQQRKSELRVIYNNNNKQVFQQGFRCCRPSGGQAVLSTTVKTSSQDNAPHIRYRRIAISAAFSSSFFTLAFLAASLFSAYILAAWAVASRSATSSSALICANSSSSFRMRSNSV